MIDYDLGGIKMTGSFNIKPIAHIKNDFPSKFGIPRQSGLLGEMRSYIIFEPEYRSEEALRGIEEFSHLWLIWQFSEALGRKFSPTVRPPRLGGNKRVGVFATRSPFRPNSLGLSSVRLVKKIKTREYGVVLEVLGADLMSGTPIFDVKPYVRYSDSHPEAVSGFADDCENYSLEILNPEAVERSVPEDKAKNLLEILKNDPRPSYQHDPNREYTLDYSEYSVKFRVDGEALTVISVEKRKESR